MDFAKLISTAGATPDGAPPATGDLFDVAKAPVEEVLNTSTTDPRIIPGITGYKLEYRCRRFFMGKELEAIDQNTKIFNERDEAEELREVLETCLQGRGVIMNRRDAILQDGSIVVWLEWGVRPAKALAEKSAADPRLSAEKLFSPERITPKSRAEDAADGDEESPAADEDEEGESYENEDDW